MNHFTLYTKGHCPFCTRAKQLIGIHGDDYSELDCTKMDVRTELLTRAPGAKTVPQIFLGDELIGGYEALVTWYEAKL